MSVVGDFGLLDFEFKLPPFIPHCRHSLYLTTRVPTSRNNRIIFVWRIDNYTTPERSPAELVQDEKNCKTLELTPAKLGRIHTFLMLRTLVSHRYNSKITGSGSSRCSKARYCPFHIRCTTAEDRQRGGNIKSRFSSGPSIHQLSVTW